jgi:carotenoid cleavage dioxygenase
MKRREFIATASASFVASMSFHDFHAIAQTISHNDKSWTSDNIFLQGINAPVFDEVDINNLKVTGEIPPDLEGMYVRNGPNPMFKPSTYNYPLEGDGMLHAIYFEGGKARYRNRWIMTRGLIDEMFEGKPIPELKWRNYANTNIIARGGMLLALYEMGLPYQITPELETIGEWDFKGKIEHAMTAHPRLDPETGELHFFHYSLFNPPYLVYYVADRQGKIIRKSPIDLPTPALIHDMAMTKNYVIFFHCPLVFDMQRAMKCGVPLVWKPEEGTKIILVNRRDLKQKPLFIETESFWAWHFMNAFEADKKITIDFAYYPQIKLESTLDAILSTKSNFQRIVIELETKAIKHQTLDDRTVDLPTFDLRKIGQPYQFGYMPHIDLDLVFQKKIPNYFPELIQYNVVKQTTKVHRFSTGCYGGEAVFAPKKNSLSELDGYIMTLVFDENKQTSDLVIIDPANFDREPIAIVHLSVRVPMGFHGNWIAKDALVISNPVEQ